MTEAELDAQCDELFDQNPIEFEARRNVELDQQIAKLIKE